MVREHRLLATDRRIRAVFGGEVIADTPAGWMGFGGYQPPLYVLGTWWFDRAHVRTELLEPSGHTTVCDVRGPATYWDVIVGDRRARHAAYAYEHAPTGWEALRGLITFAWNDIDHWYEEELEVFVHPRGPLHRVDALRSSRHVQVSLDGGRSPTPRVRWRCSRRGCRCAGTSRALGSVDGNRCANGLSLPSVAWPLIRVEIIAGRLSVSATARRTRGSLNGGLSFRIEISR